ncbi:hypothetical protein [Pleionea sediminis]|uniref:hypothetical protein n=1 Tax=Pleionea sediminis TaxID=2569479 RepID=UPI001184BF02|nr:hypothetical protein [Pleionea sediminis]
MIDYRLKEEKDVALFFANKLNDGYAEEIINRGQVETSAQARHLAQFFWNMVNYSSQNSIDLPVDGSSELWLEKLYNTLGGYLESLGYEKQWNEEVDKA